MISDEVSSVREGGSAAVVEGRQAFLVVVCTVQGATVKLLFEHQTHCKVWKASIESMFAEHKLKRANNTE
jgi:hypothetical protein